MKRNITISLLLVVAVAGCQEYMGDISNSGQSKVFSSSMESYSPDTKTALFNYNYVQWSSGDRIAIFQGRSVADIYEIESDYVGSEIGSFSCVSVNGGSDNVFNTNVAFYPYSEEIACSSSVSQTNPGAYTVTGVEFPEVQIFAENSFGGGVFPMVAVTEDLSDRNLQFRNLFGVLRLALTGSGTVSSIKVEGKNGEKLSGSATVTAYAGETAPSVAFDDDAMTYVVLDCGDGVPLSVTETAFNIALPPVDFDEGFKITITDSEDRIRILETDYANPVLRSSIHMMPVKFMGISMKSSLTLMPGMEYALDVEALLAEGTSPVLEWESSDEDIVMVAQDGTVTAVADGTATVTVSAADGSQATCSVTVKTKTTTAVASLDYIDEYNVNHGRGIVVDDVVWAPVNCGYKVASADSKGYPYGKHYQWGRKYGQGYNGELVGDSYVDEDYPSEADLVTAPVAPEQGSLPENEKVFFSGSSWWFGSPSATVDSDLWDRSDGSKAQNDPCPDGWRLPLSDEFNSLIRNYSPWMNVNGQSGCYFSGEYTYIDSDEVSKVFLPASGLIVTSPVYGTDRNNWGHYWTSSIVASYLPYPFCLSFTMGSAYVGMDGDFGRGYSVRCVQILTD